MPAEARGSNLPDAGAIDGGKLLDVGAGFKLRSSGRAICVLNQGHISPAPEERFFEMFLFDRSVCLSIKNFMNSLSLLV